MVSVLDPAELWPVWMPPTPPASDQEFDVYTDPVVGFWYEYEPLAEADLPPVFNEVVPMKTPVKVQEKQKHRPSPVKKEAICEVKDRSRSSSIDTVDMCRQASQGSSSLVDLGQTSSSNNSASFAARSLFDGGPSSRYRRDQRRPLTPPALPDDLEQDSYEGPPWTVIEDYAIMQAVTKGQQMAYNFLTANFGHAPNWDFIASRVNFVSDTYRSPRQCSLRFQRTLLPREDGRMVVHDPVTKKPYRVPEEEKSKRVKTGQLWQSEARTVMAQRTGKRFRIVTNKAVQRRHSICKLKFPVSLSRVGRELPEKHARYMHQFAINYSLALSPSAMADIRIERQRERDRQQAEKDRLTREQQVALEEKVRLSQQIQTVTQPPITTPVQSESSPSQSSWSPLTFDLSPISSTPSVLPAWQLPPLGTFANPAIRSQALPAIRPSMVGQHYVTVSQALQGPPAAVLASTQILSPSLAPTVSVSLQQSTGGTPLVNLLPTQGQQLQQVQGVNRYVVGTVAYTLNSQSNQPVQYVVSSTPHTAGRQPSPYTRTTVTRIATPPSTPNSLMGSNLVPVSVAVSSTPQTTQQAIRVSNAQIRPKLAGTVGGSFLIPTDRTTTQIRTQSLARPFQPSIVRRPSSLPKIQTIQSRATTPALTGQPRITRPILSRTPSGTVASSEAAVTESIPSISNIVSPQPRDTHATPTNQTTPQK